MTAVTVLYIFQGSMGIYGKEQQSEGENFISDGTVHAGDR